MARNRTMVGLVFLTFFVMSFLTNIQAPLVPDIINNFRLNLTATALLQFSFFIAYGLISIPAGFWVERYSEKPVMIAAFLAGTVGTLSFALFPAYAVGITSFFVTGAGMATLQVAINPLLRVSGGEEHFAFNSAFAQLVFGLASFGSPRVYSYLVENLSNHAQPLNAFLRVLAAGTPANLPWVSIYWIFAVCCVVMMLVIARLKFPRVERTEDERAGSIEMYLDLLRKPIVWLFFLSVFCYVSCEQGTSYWISEFLSRYHGYDPHTTGASAVSWFWGLLTAGCFIGMGLLKLFDSRRVLIAFSVGALLCLTAALFGPSTMALYAFPCVGLFASIMWPVLVSLALNSVSEHHGPFTGILSTGIMGGAVGPVIIGRLGDHFGLRSGLYFLYLTFGCVLSVGFWAKPLITNATLHLKKGVAEPSA
jgi:MFS transporter, FHS family, L-fucose permease